MSICYPDTHISEGKKWREGVVKLQGKNGLGHRHTHISCLSASLRLLCSAPNVITLQGHAVYSSPRLGIRYTNTLSIRVCARGIKQKVMCVTESF